VLVPFFQDAPEALWSGFILIEDSSGAWRLDLFSFLAGHGYAVAARTKQNVMLRREPGTHRASSTDAASPAFRR
jgi:hypothetical protein